MACDDIKFLICIVLLVSPYSGAIGCRFGDEPNCGFPCRCKERTCNPETGSCDIQGCQEDNVVPFEGDGCLIGNVAYKKIATDSGAYGDRIANRSVDGNIGPVDQQYCSLLTDSDSNVPQAWWSVNLGSAYTVTKVIIFNRDVHRYRATNIDIRVGIEDTFDEMEICTSYQADPIHIPDITYLDCFKPIPGQHVTIKRMVNGREPDYLNFCEVAVMAYKAIRCDNCLGPCDRLTGCSACPVGMKLPDCEEACPDGYTGVNCASRCGMCKPGFVCDKVTGSCGQQCDGWYIPESCVQVLTQPPVTSNATILKVTSNSATVQWVTEEKRDAEVLQYFKYILQYGPADENATSWNVSESIHIPFHSRSFNQKLLDLISGTEYIINIIPYRYMNSKTEEGVPVMLQFKTLGIEDIESTPDADETTEMLHVEADLTTEILQVEREFVCQTDEGPYTVAVIVGTVATVVVMILFVVIVLLVIRQRRSQKTLETGASTEMNREDNRTNNPTYADVNDYEALGATVASSSEYKSYGK